MASAFSLDTLIILAGSAVFIAFLFGLYSYLLKPKYTVPGVYTNPKIGRRKIPVVVTPDTIGLLRGFIDEEGDAELGSEYTTLILESEGQEIPIPHVNINRDLKPFNFKQAYAGSDSPVLICAVDRNGLRNPGAVDALHAGSRLKDLDLENLEKERRRLMTDFARAKQHIRNTMSDEFMYDKFEDWAGRTGRIRQAVNRFDTDEEKEEHKEGRS